MLPYGSPSGFPLASVYSRLKAPVRPPIVTALYHPVAVMLVPALPAGMMMSLTNTVIAPSNSPIPSRTSMCVRLPSFFEKTTRGAYHAVPYTSGTKSL